MAATLTIPGTILPGYAPVVRPSTRVAAAPAVKAEPLPQPASPPVQRNESRDESSFQAAAENAPRSQPSDKRKKKISDTDFEKTAGIKTSWSNVHKKFLPAVLLDWRFICRIIQLAPLAATLWDVAQAWGKNGKPTKPEDIAAFLKTMNAQFDQNRRELRLGAKTINGSKLPLWIQHEKGFHRRGLRRLLYAQTFFMKKWGESESPKFEDFDPLTLYEGVLMTGTGILLDGVLSIDAVKGKFDYKSLDPLKDLMNDEKFPTDTPATPEQLEEATKIMRKFLEELADSRREVADLESHDIPVSEFLKDKSKRLTNEQFSILRSRYRLSTAKKVYTVVYELLMLGSMAARIPQWSNIKAFSFMSKATVISDTVGTFLPLRVALGPACASTQSWA